MGVEMKWSSQLLEIKVTDYQNYEAIDVGDMKAQGKPLIYEN